MRDYINAVHLLELNGYRNSEEAQRFKDIMKPASQSFMPSESRKALLGQFLEYLEGNGYTPITVGSFGAVFTHSNLDYVIKIFKDDPPYMRFLKFALANQSNPNLPRFRGKFMKIDEHHYAVRIEKLDPVRASALVADLCSAFSYIEAMSPNQSVEEFIDFVGWHFKEKKPLSARYITSILKEDPNLFETVKLLIRANGGQYDFDFHSKNIMKRGKTFVIIDPYFAQDSLYNGEE